MEDSKSNTLAQEYFNAEKFPASQTFQFDPSNAPSGDDRVVIRNKDDDKTLAFVIPNLLDEEECDALVSASETHGIHAPTKHDGTLRTAKRTKQYQNHDLSKVVRDRLLNDHDDIFSSIDEEDDMGQFYGLHSNWRVVRYDPCGDSFPAHQDQMDSLQMKNEDGTKECVMSSHTLIINLSAPGVEGGATRFYPDAKVRTATPGQYSGRTVDIFLPRGWALVFRQKGLIHAGQPVTGSQPKYVAQAGVLRLIPQGKLVTPSVFRLGPGLSQLIGLA